MLSTRFSRIAISSLLAVGAVAGCSSSAEDLSDEELRDQLIETFTSGDDALSDEQATCIADQLFERAERDELNRLADADDVNDFTEEDTALMIEIAFDCI